MLIYRLCSGESVYRDQQSIVVLLAGKRRVLSTGPHNGGLREDLTAVFNYDCTTETEAAQCAATYARHMALVAQKLGLDGQTATGLSTAAQMEHASIQTASYQNLTVTAIVTGGIDVNGGRAGDLASWDEMEDLPKTPHGTINILLFCNVDLTPEALVRSLVTCTEAKTAALQELLAPSRYSNGLATGSGTDGTILVANRDSPICLKNAGKHCKLGELIGRTVIAGVKEALFLQTGLCPARQRTVLRRVDRFGLSGKNLQTRLGTSAQGAAWSKMEKLLAQEALVAPVSLYVHLMDQVSWGLLTVPAAFREGEYLLERIAPGTERRVWDETDSLQDAVETLTKNLEDTLIALLKTAI